MKSFTQMQQREAIAHAAEGGQSLHIIDGSWANLRSDTPQCFKGKRQIAHLFDQDAERLQSTARKLGVRVVRIERRGQPGQHVDLCGKPLGRAQAQCEEAEGGR